MAHPRHPKLKERFLKYRNKWDLFAEENDGGFLPVPLADGRYIVNPFGEVYDSYINMRIDQEEENTVGVRLADGQYRITRSCLVYLTFFEDAHLKDCIKLVKGWDRVSPDNIMRCNTDVPQKRSFDKRDWDPFPKLKKEYRAYHLQWDRFMDEIGFVPVPGIKDLFISPLGEVKDNTRMRRYSVSSDGISLVSFYDKKMGCTQKIYISDLVGKAFLEIKNSEREHIFRRSYNNIPLTPDNLTIHYDEATRAKKRLPLFYMNEVSGEIKALEKIIDLYPTLGLYPATLYPGIKDPNNVVKRGKHLFSRDVNSLLRYFEENKHV